MGFNKRDAVKRIAELEAGVARLRAYVQRQAHTSFLPLFSDIEAARQADQAHRDEARALLAETSRPSTDAVARLRSEKRAAYDEGLLRGWSAPIDGRLSLEEFRAAALAEYDKREGAK